MMSTMSKLYESARALIFDCDGTLADSASLYARVIAEGFAHTGVHMSAEWYYPRHGLSSPDLMDAFENEFGVRIDRQTALQIMATLYLDHIDDLEEIKAVADIARHFHGKKPMAVASGGPATIVRASLVTLGLLPLFDTVVTYEDTGKAKPDPALFLEAARRLNVAPEHCLVFEDSPQGLEAAFNAGMPVIDITKL